MQMLSNELRLFSCLLTKMEKSPISNRTQYEHAERIQFLAICRTRSALRVLLLDAGPKPRILHAERRAALLESERLLIETYPCGVLLLFSRNEFLSVENQAKSQLLRLLTTQLCKNRYRLYPSSAVFVSISQSSIHRSIKHPPDRSIKQHGQIVSKQNRIAQYIFRNSTSSVCS